MFAFAEPVRQVFPTNPALWGLADLVIATLVGMILICRDDLFGRIMARTLWVCMAIVLVFPVLDGYWAVAVLFVLLAWRAHRLARTPEAGTRQVTRAYLAAMLAGIPTLIAYAWGAGEIAVGVLFAVFFFALSAVFRLRPPLEAEG
jgi:hypothetical protein